MNKKLQRKFFSRNAKIVAQEILGKILVRKINGKEFRSRIVESEAYFGCEDPASRASKGKNKVSEMMWASPGKILVYNVHKYNMFNLVTGKIHEPSAVLIRALEPLNFKARLSGPGLLTDSLKIDKKVHGKEIFGLKDLWLADCEENFFEIAENFRVGVTKDLPERLRFYIKDNKFVSRK